MSYAVPALEGWVLQPDHVYADMALMRSIKPSLWEIRLEPGAGPRCCCLIQNCSALCRMNLLIGCGRCLSPLTPQRII
jgi:hypothetical protein